MVGAGPKAAAVRAMRVGGRRGTAARHRARRGVGPGGEPIQKYPPPHTTPLRPGTRGAATARGALGWYRPSVGVPRDVGCCALVVFVAYIFSVQFRGLPCPQRGLLRAPGFSLRAPAFVTPLSSFLVRVDKSSKGRNRQGQKKKVVEATVCRIMGSLIDFFL